MRFLSFLNILLTAAAFAITLVLLFAGRNPGQLENLNILTLNTSQVGSVLLTSSSSPIQGLIPSQLQPVASTLENQVSAQVANSIASQIGIHDFYSLHLLDYCEGYYTPQSLAESNVTISENITGCSNTSALWNFNVSSILQSELKPPVSLIDIKFPQDVQDVFYALQIAFRAMIVLYCVAVAFCGLGLLFGLIGLLVDNRITSFLNWAWIVLAFLATAAASGIATAVTIEVTNEVNDFTNSFGASAYRGYTFLTLTWVASAVLLLATVIWCIDCIVGGRHRKRMGEPSGYAYGGGEKYGRHRGYGERSSSRRRFFGRSGDDVNNGDVI